MALQVGSQAPDFTLKSNKMQDVKLAELRGNKVLLLFVPLAFTAVCTKELCSMRDGLKDYEGLDCKVYGISTDSPFALDAWAQKEGYQFPLLSDYNKTVARVLRDALRRPDGLQGRMQALRLRDRSRRQNPLRFRLRGRSRRPQFRRDQGLSPAALASREGRTRTAPVPASSLPHIIILIIQFPSPPSRGVRGEVLQYSVPLHVRYLPYACHNTTISVIALAN